VYTDFLLNDRWLTVHRLTFRLTLVLTLVHFAFPWKFYTLEYFWVKAILTSMRLWTYLVAIPSVNTVTRQTPGDNSRRLFSLPFSYRCTQCTVRHAWTKSMVYGAPSPSPPWASPMDRSPIGAQTGHVASLKARHKSGPDWPRLGPLSLVRPGPHWPSTSQRCLLTWPTY
jgi:hypothetical protein